jgi:DNA-binding response OmpR family regulator
MADHLFIGDNRNEVFYVGYKLKVTPSEYKILSAIAKNGRCTTTELAGELGFGKTKRGNVPVHICSINRKAETIGARKLILSSGSEYYFNENM